MVRDISRRTKIGFGAGASAEAISLITFGAYAMKKWGRQSAPNAREVVCRQARRSLRIATKRPNHGRVMSRVTLRCAFLFVTFVCSCGGVMAAPPTAQASGSAAAARPPNVVLILADDLGYADVSAYFPGRIPTPNIDRIGAEGVRFTAGYVAAPVCGPSRAALMTGRYPQRFGFEFNNGPPARDVAMNIGLAKTELTLGNLMQQAGYHTGLVGKWHLGANADFYPTGRGFDEFFGILPGATSYIDPTLPGVHNVAPPGAEAAATRGRAPELQVFRGPAREVVDNANSYLTEEFAAEAESFIGRNKDKPFLLYLAFNAPHAPYQVTQKYYDRFAHISDELPRVYAGMVSALDDAVGRVLAALQANGIADETLVLFISDNGCAAYVPQLCSCEPMRGGKLSHFEGGVRVPFLLRWPGHVPAGSVHALPVSTLDIVPTVVAAAQAQLPADRAYDGSDLLAQLGRGSDPARELFWWRAPLRSVRVGDWKLWTSEQGDLNYLFNLADDPHELNNLVEARPDKAEELRSRLLQWHVDKAAPAWPSRPHVTYEACDATITVPI